MITFCYYSGAEALAAKNQDLLIKETSKVHKIDILAANRCCSPQFMLRLTGTLDFRLIDQRALVGVAILLSKAGERFVNLHTPNLTRF